MTGQQAVSIYHKLFGIFPTRREKVRNCGETKRDQDWIRGQVAVSKRQKLTTWGWMGHKFRKGEFNYWKRAEPQTDFCVLMFGEEKQICLSGSLEAAKRGSDRVLITVFLMLKCGREKGNTRDYKILTCWRNVSREMNLLRNGRDIRWGSAEFKKNRKR